MKVSVEVLRGALRALVSASHGTTAERELVLLRIEDSSGVSGWGEAAPLPSYDGVSVDDVLAALDRALPQLERWDGNADDARHFADLPQAVAAIDLAFWDYRGRATGEPVWRLLGGSEPSRVAVNATIAASDRAGASAEAFAAREAGFECVKLKVGIGDDAGRVAAVRAALGGEIALRLDANGAWSVDEALASLRVLAPAGIELCEEPVHGLAAARIVADAAGVGIALDESAALPGALTERCCDAVCLKVSSCGGITGLLAAAAQARTVGYDVYLASTLDGPLGLAAALHACAAVVPDRACGLATMALFARECAVLTPSDGFLTAPAGRGLGAGLRAWYVDL